MKPPSIAPAFACLYPLLAEAARAHGYALALHGTLARDLDVVAIPWTAEASDAETVVAAIAEASGGRLLGEVVSGREEPQRKPHGRRAWGIMIEWAFIDLSVMPRC